MGGAPVEKSLVEGQQPFVSVTSDAITLLVMLTLEEMRDSVSLMIRSVPVPGGSKNATYHGPAVGMSITVWYELDWGDCHVEEV